MKKPSFSKNNKTKVCPMQHTSSSSNCDDSVTSTQECSLGRIRRTQSVPTFENEDFDVGRFLGAGAFCGVFEASLSHRYTKKLDKLNNNISLNQSHVVAIKKVQGNGLCERRMNYALQDLDHETDVLSSLDHKNIIRMFGAGPSPSVRNQNKECLPFLVLEKLNCTLEERLRSWDMDLRRLSNARKEIASVERQRLFRSRLQVAASIASALSYMHSNNIIFRDLKPSNIGFDAHGDVKLFDLGLSVRTDNLNTTRTSLTECCGSPRYMAPEVFEQKKEYSYSVDVYSFSILLWEICSLKKPFGDCTSLKKVRKKVLEGSRPKIPSNWNMSLQSLISRSWQSDPSLRPSMNTVQKVLNYEIVNFRFGPPSPSQSPLRLISFTDRIRRQTSTH